MAGKLETTDASSDVPAQDNAAVRPVPTRVLRGDEFLHDPDSAEQIASLAYTGATDAEIADYLELSVAVIRGKFGKQLKRGRASMRIGLRKKQIQLATVEDGDVRLLQFLGKHYLGQSESTGDAVGTEPVKTYQNVRIEDI